MVSLPLLLHSSHYTKYPNMFGYKCHPLLMGCWAEGGTRCCGSPTSVVVAAGAAGGGGRSNRWPLAETMEISLQKSTLYVAENKETERMSMEISNEK